MESSLILFPEGDALQDNYQILYREVFLQIKKDFHPHADAGEAPELITPQWLYNKVFELLTDILARQASALGAIVYRVDLPEKSTKKNLEHSEENEQIPNLTMMILRREAQKIWLRRKFRP
jgi:hypothetical protein